MALHATGTNGKQKCSAKLTVLAIKPRELKSLALTSLLAGCAALFRAFYQRGNDVNKLSTIMRASPVVVAATTATTTTTTGRQHHYQSNISIPGTSVAVSQVLICWI